MRPSIRHLITVALAVGAAALVLAACGGDSGDDDGTATATGSDIVSVQSIDGTNVLADSDGRTLYSADVEQSGIRCTEACTSFWDPVNASASEARSAAADLDLDLDTVKRPDGERQLALDGLPLYTFTEEGAHELDGDGFVDDFQGTHFEWAAASTGAESMPSGGSAPSDSSPY
jgi:predicted lipoprotein with Yx(FWY)xxD motif